MKPYKAFLIGVLVTVFAYALFWAGTAYASTGCFTDTNGHWAETFVCWLKDSGITSGYGDGTYGPNDNITRGQMAVFLQKIYQLADSSSQTKANTAETNAKNYATTKANTAETNAKNYANSLHIGDIYINAGANNIQPVGSTTSTFVWYFNDWQELRSSAAGTYHFLFTADLPSTLYGKQVYLHGVKLCYMANLGTPMTYVSLRHYLGNGSLYNSVTDTTSRTDATCRTYILPFDGSIFGSEHIVLEIGATYSGAGVIGIRTATFILKPSTLTGSLMLDIENERPDIAVPEIVPGSHDQ